VLVLYPPIGINSCFSAPPAIIHLPFHFGF
jgi:hypothetical protein